MNGGGPAFPVPVVCDPVHGLLSASQISSDSSGMSLRAYFAGQALQGILADHEFHKDLGTWDVVAREAVFAADALIKALEEGSE